MKFYIELLCKIERDTHQMTPQKGERENDLTFINDR